MQKLEPITIALFAIVAIGVVVAVAASYIAIRGGSIDQWMKEVVLMIITYLAGLVTPSRRETPPVNPTTVVIDTNGGAS